MKTTTPTALVDQAADRARLERMDAARTATWTKGRVVQELDKMIRSKSWWLDNHGTGQRSRPDHEVNARKREMTALVLAMDIVLERDPDAAGR